MELKTALELYERMKKQIDAWTQYSRLKKTNKFPFHEAGIPESKELEILEKLCNNSGYIIVEAHRGKEEFYKNEEFPKVVLLGYQEFFLGTRKNYTEDILRLIDRLVLETSFAGVPLLTPEDAVLVGFGGIKGELVYGERKEGCVQTRNPDNIWEAPNQFLHSAYEIFMLGHLKVIFSDAPELSKKISGLAVRVIIQQPALYIDAVKKRAKEEDVKRRVTAGSVDLKNEKSPRDYIEELEKKRADAEKNLKDHVGSRLERLERDIIPCLRGNIGHRKVYQLIELEDIVTCSVQNSLQECGIPYLVAVPGRPPMH